MTKKHFISLADFIRSYQCSDNPKLQPAQIEMLASFCRQHNPNFNRERWLDYIAGKRLGMLNNEILDGAAPTGD